MSVILDGMKWNNWVLISETEPVAKKLLIQGFRAFDDNKRGTNAMTTIVTLFRGW